MNLKIEVFGHTFNLLYIIPMIFIYFLLVTSTCCGCMSWNVPYVEGFQQYDQAKQKKNSFFKPKEEVVFQPIPFQMTTTSAEVPNYHCASCHKA